MATTPAAGELRQTLKHLTDGVATARLGSDSVVEAVQQAFKDAGYMTAEEWSTKFLHELELLGDAPLRADLIALAIKRVENQI